jgi:hypothetical protein
MLNPPGHHRHSLGLSVGATNIAGTRDGHSAAIHPAEVTSQGRRLTGFVDRVGDPVPLVAPDGSKHNSERLVAEALGAMADALTHGMPVSETAVAVPAHWSAPVVDALRRRLGDGMPVVSDATAALTALRAKPGLPTRGVIVLCDFGGSGTSITLADAASNYAPIGETVRFSDFSGDQIDQALLRYVVVGLLDSSQADPASTAMVGSLVRLRDECRFAKERLSAETSTAIAADVPGYRGDIRVTRTELEELIQAPLADFLAALDETLERNRVPAASVSAVATVGGGARIPLITQRLSEHLRAPVVTTPHPQLTAAEGAVLLAHRSRIAETATALTPAAHAAAPVTVSLVAHEHKLAWSEDDDRDDALPHGDVTDSRPEMLFRHEEWQDAEEPPRRGPLVLFGLSAVAAAIASAVFGFTLLNDTTTTPVDAAATATSTAPPPAAPALLPAPPAPQAPEVTTVVMQKPVQRSYPAPQQPRPQAPATQQPPAPPTTTEPTTTTPTTTTPPTTTPPTTTPPSTTTPPPPPIDPGTGGGTGTPPPPIDPGTGAGGPGTTTPPIDPGTGSGGTSTAPGA